MIQSLALREFGKVVLTRSAERIGRRIATQLRANDEMRRRSWEVAGKRYVR